MLDELTHIDDFLKKLKAHTERKKSLYDGSNRTLPIDFCLRLAIEELGEIAGAITRSRTTLAEYECIDLAHCAYLIYQTLQRSEETDA